MDRGGPGLQVTLVESIGKKAKFLADVAEKTGAPVQVLPVRVEHLAEPPVVDVVTARAMAPLTKLLGYVIPLWKRARSPSFPRAEASMRN
jgi:16S rRNA (guanine527-N7)-methyltransferase